MSFVLKLLFRKIKKKANTFRGLFMFLCHWFNEVVSPFFTQLKCQRVTVFEQNCCNLALCIILQTSLSYFIGSVSYPRGTSTEIYGKIYAAIRTTPQQALGALPQTPNYVTRTAASHNARKVSLLFTCCCFMYSSSMLCL